jgi:hypothetical protein
MRSAAFILMAVISGATVAQEPTPQVVAPSPQSETAPPSAAKAAPAKRVRVKRQRIPSASAYAHLGLAVNKVEDSDKDCFGGQYGAGLRASGLYVRWTRTSLSYEASDHSGSCDGLLWGDSTIRESAWTGGFMLGRSGLFAGFGATDVNVERSYSNDVDFGRDHGHRYEIGYTSRMKVPHGLGFEVLLFRGINDVRDYGGLAFSFSFGT